MSLNTNINAKHIILARQPGKPSNQNNIRLDYWLKHPYLKHVQKSFFLLYFSVKAIIEEILKMPLESHVKYVVLELCCEQNDEDVEIPYVKFKID